MSNDVLRPEIGQWCTRTDKGAMFQVVGRDEASRAIEIQSFDGEIDEIDAETWATLPLERSAPPENWTGPVDDVEMDDLGYAETEMRPADWTESLQPDKSAGESWEDVRPEDERDEWDEGAPAEPVSAELPETKGRAD